MSATDLLSRLAAEGLTARADGDRLLVAPKERITPELRAAIRANKAELLAALTGEGCPRCGRPSPAPGAWCDACLDATWPAPLIMRYPVVVRWARERGVVRVRDPFTGGWHELAAQDAPPCWLDELRRRRN